MCDNLMCSLEECNIPYSTCHCGCEEITTIVVQNHSRNNLIKGEYSRYILGHQPRTSPLEYIVDAETGCWEWQRGKDDNGYGKTSFEGKDLLAHRHFYEICNGAIPEGLHLDHLCRNPGCCNPKHLEAVTCAVNLRRGNGTKLTQEDVDKIRGEYRNMTRKDIAKMFGITTRHVYDIFNYTSWK